MSRQCDCRDMRKISMWSNPIKHVLNYSAPNFYRISNLIEKTSVGLRPGGRLNKKDGLTRYGDSHVKDKTS